MRRLSGIRPKEKKFFYKLLLGLLVCAVVPTTITVYVMYRHYFNSMMQEIGGANHRILEQAKLNSDMMVNEMTHAAGSLISDPQVGFFMRSDYTQDAKSFNDLVNKLGQLKSASNYISSIAIHFDQYDYIIGADDMGPTFFRNRDQMEESGWTVPYKKPDLRQNRFEMMGDNTGSDLYMIRPIYNASYLVVGAVVVKVSGERFRANFDQMRMSNPGTIAIVDRKGNDVWCEGEGCGDPRLRSVADGRTNGEFQVVKYGEQKLVFSESYSDVSQWQFYSFTPIRHLTVKLNVFGHLTLLIVLIVITASIIFSLVYGRYLYKPLRDLLLRILISPMPDAQLKGKDEFRMIDQAYHRMLLDKSDLQQFIDNNKELMRNKLLYNVVMGVELEEGKIREAMRYLEIELPGRRLQVLLVEMFKMALWEHDSYKRSATGMMAIYSLCQDMLDRLPLVGLAFELDPHTIAVIAAAENEEAEQGEGMAGFVDAMQSAAAEYLHIPIRIGVGGEVDKLADLYASYREARIALAYSPGIGEAGSAAPAFDISLYEKKICYGIAVKDEASIENAIDDMMDLASKHGAHSGPRTLNAWLQVLSASMRKLEEVDVFVYQELMQQPIYNQLLGLESAQDVREWLKQLYQGMLFRLREAEEKNNIPHRKVERVEQMIREQYDRDLTLEMAADEVGLNAAYLSKLFKDVTGSNFVEYLNQIRIEKSKALLAQMPVLSLEDIARRVGYNNTQSFNRFFKKYESCTPGKFRQTLSETR